MHGTMMDYPLTLNLILDHVGSIHANKKVHTLLPNGKLHSYTYDVLCQRVRKLANALCEFGIQQGDRVATFASNTYQHLELFYAIPAAAGVIHPINVRMTPKQQAKIVRQAEDKLFFVDGLFSDEFSELQKEVDTDVSIHFNVDENNQPEEMILDYEDCLDRVDKVNIPEIKDENCALALCYTSGTSGEPKGILYTHRSVFLHTLAVNQTEVFGITESDVVLPLVPMYHALAWGLPYAAMFVGADIVLHGMDFENVIDLISETGVTIAAGVPTIWGKLLPDLQRRRQDVSSLHRIIVGGEPMSSQLIHTFENDLGIEVRHAWGMTEMSPTGTSSTLRKEHQHLSDEEKHNIKAKQGRPIPGVQIRLASEDEYDLPWDGETTGELQVRSPWTTGRYYKSTVSPEHFTEDGWLRTGDIAAINHEGYVQIVDRAKALIKSGGETISTTALEAVLLQHHLVKDVAVIGIQNEYWGERPIAIVVLSENPNQDISKALSEHVIQELPKFWLPDEYIYVDEIPKTGVGKTDKNAIMKILSKSN